MTLRVGDIVITHGVAQSNATDVHPAIVTRVWGHSPEGDAFCACNMTVFPDYGPPEIHTSVPVFATKEAADRHNENLPYAGPKVRYAVLR